jgi:hypothetical protein
VRKRALGGAALAMLACAGTAEAGPPGKWTQVTTSGPSTIEIGLARTADGVLHVSWRREAGGGSTLLHSAVSANAKAVSGPDTIFESTDGINESSALVRTPEGLRVFFAATNRFDDAMGTATSADGKAWSPAATASRGGNDAKPVYAASGIGAALAPNGTFFSAWGSSAPGGEGFHVGLDPNAPDGSLGGGSVIDPGVGVDSKTSAAYVAGNLLDEDGVMVLPISPAGPRVTIPSSGAAQTQHRVGITGRIGAGGVVVAYTQGDNQFTGRPAIYRVDTGKVKRISNRRGAEKISIAAAPGGRVWVFWKDGGTVFATRSNKAATRFGTIVSVRAPKRSDTIHSLAGEGSRGPLDVLALADVSGAGVSNWHQRILPGLTLKAKAGKGGKVTFTATDAGAPVGGVKVKVKGEGSKTTGGSGKVSFTLGEGRHRGTATKSGYVPAAARVRVR